MNDWKVEVGNWKLEIGGWKLEDGTSPLKLGGIEGGRVIGSWKLQIRKVTT